MNYKKNLQCIGCEYYNLTGGRKCSAIQQKFYQEFKGSCPCRPCMVRILCKSKSHTLLNAMKLDLILRIVNIPEKGCELFSLSLGKFIDSRPQYFKNSCYRDPIGNEIYILKKKAQKVLVSAMENKHD